MKDESRIRAFIAVRIPPDVQAEIVRVSDAIRQFHPPLRWTAIENIHVTLKFLGDVDSGRISDVRRAMEESARNTAPLRLKARGIGVFPGVKNPRVLWVGMGGWNDRLVDAQRNLDQRLSAMGFEKDARPFRGHVTLARIKGRTDPMIFSNIIQTHGTFESSLFTADRLVLFKSVLTPAGPVYSELEQVFFPEPEPGAFSS